MYLRIEEPVELWTVNGILHDYWFDLDRIKDWRGATLEIPFAKSTRDVADQRWLYRLDLHGALRVNVIDDAGVQYFDLASIKWDLASRVLVLECGVPFIARIEGVVMPIELQSLFAVREEDGP